MQFAACSIQYATYVASKRNECFQRCGSAAHRIPDACAQAALQRMDAARLASLLENSVVELNGASGKALPRVPPT